ncbi:hypothetical protein O6H91_22G012400 [Diphasiastrum complanatum]|uniref:Uncharacterized protein n=1 Tax=Diphasiastrum complanatum TaxID=34168 RepID=A0ACC2ACZ6_DIPCM|nr:hypothetical protein O6H91_22G012400 [Diphasiastrum complanatum]
MGGQKRGALIVLEGLDRSGKSSQCASLVSFLQQKGLEAEAWRFPDRTTAVGTMLSSYLTSATELDDHAVHLLFSANRWEKRALLEGRLKAGTTLVVDRYAHSGVAFSAAKGLDLEWCKAPETGLPSPDLVLYLNIPAEVAAARGGYGAERYEDIGFQKKVALQFELLRASNWEVVDGRLSFDDVQEIVRKHAVSAINKCQGGRDLLRLWPN